MLKAIDRNSFERGNFLVLHPVLLKFAYLNSGNRQISIAVLSKELRQKGLSIPLEAHHNAPSREITIASHNFFVLGPIMVKFHIRTCLIESFTTIIRTWWCGEEKLHFTPF